MTFIEAPRFPTDINYGIVGGPKYKTNLIEKNSGWENANAVWPQGRHEYDLVYAVKDQITIEALLAFFHATKGRSVGFRFKDWADFKSCGVDSMPAFTDQLVSGVPDGFIRSFQLAKNYIKGSISTVRLIKKPVSGTVIVGIGGLLANGVTVDTTTGIITFPADITGSVTEVTQANPCVLTANNNLAENDTIYISGIVGMTQLNGNRYRVLSRTSTTITIDVNSTSFSTYSSGGTFHTVPQTSEVITAGFEFDVPVRFTNDEFNVSIDSFSTRTVQNLILTEIRV
jgi:uncharacterized protein (TIGR02217 family)